MEINKISKKSKTIRFFNKKKQMEINKISKKPKKKSGKSIFQKNM